ncbi:hypothetical protein ElyMa_003093200 [Elysia marginata]|uniref:DDE-1 domain-containing protein n=1 Tax=Elysia marginata TaxID=1093978 RepID=A0AAV4IPN7_9GAST|nr:hypothetical protein ElyMa_003093200 [Elysia marginata]
MYQTNNEGEEISAPEKFTFFCDMSMQEFSFGVGALGVNGLCLGMMLNIPTLTLHNLMYKVAPKGILQPDTTDQERVWVARVVIDHWYRRTAEWPPRKRFKMLYDAFKMLKEKRIAEEIKKRFEADEPMTLEMFYTFDLGRMGPYVPPLVEVDNGVVEGEEEEAYAEEEEEEENAGAEEED